MKKTIAWLWAMTLAVTTALAQGRLDFNSPSIPQITEMKPDVSSGHSVSVSLLGLEYNYELALQDNWSLVMRAGLPCVLTGYYYHKQVLTESVQIMGQITETHSTTSGEFMFYWGPRPGITVEPRYYTNLQRKGLRGKKNVNNSANFISIQAKAYVPDFQFSTVCFSLIPAYGIRRGGTHWFIEGTLGLAFHTRSIDFAPVLPHLGFKVGYTI